MKFGRSRGASSIATTAALSVAILIVATGSIIGDKVRTRQVAQATEARIPAERQEYIPLADANSNGTPDWQEELLGSGIEAATTSLATTTEENDPAALLGKSLLGSIASGYLSLKEYDQYTPARGEQLAQSLLNNFRAPTLFVPHTKEELRIDADTSPERIARYRSDMQRALAPMVDLSAEPEFSLFARFIQTGDEIWLQKLLEVTERYRGVEKALLAVSVPQGAADVHLRATNALGTFTETLERLVRFSRDPIAQMALLRTYNEAEREFLLAFDALAKFYVATVKN